ncbi:hypothetical protein DL95DRAFT_469740 [Leptodontidium sp. 2 PMI_412]|nr:hypothetical protein DL95DRAFT_469740 [Leptodontidium sp. 2 PMI_412]
METVEIYAACISSIFAAFFVLAFRPYIWQFVEYVALLLCKLQFGTTVFRNKAWSHDFSRAYITRVNNTVRIRITTSRQVEVKKGQYINIWIPSISWYILQSYPFVVTNWVDGKQGTLELFIQPRRGFTRELFSHGTTDARDVIPRLVLFSGPHGINIPVVEYETVLMVATGFGIAALLSYVDCYGEKKKANWPTAYQGGTSHASVSSGQ